MTPEQGFIDTTDDAVLGGRLRLYQPKRGHRVGHDAILLAAATHAWPGEHAVDIGAGVGAAGLALAVRVSGLEVTLIDIDKDLCALAAKNTERNGLSDRVKTFVCDVENQSALATVGLAAGSIDRVLMNPPFNDSRRHNVSPDRRRRSAHVAMPGLFDRWIATVLWLLKPNGVLTLIWRADALNNVIASLKPYFGDIIVLPIYPYAEAPAIRVIVRAVKGREGGQSEIPGLILNDDGGRPTKAAEAILRGGEPLSFQF